MLIYEALAKDHRNVKKLLSQLVKLNQKDERKRHSLINKIRDELIPHARAEESVFYNSLRAIDAGTKTVMHGFQQHFEAETLLRMLQIRDTIDAEWKETARKLQTSVEHHIEEEEEKIFPIARNAFTADEARMMTKAFKSLKPKVKKEGFMKTTADLVTNLMPPRFAANFRSKRVNAKLYKLPIGRSH